MSYQSSGSLRTMTLTLLLLVLMGMGLANLYSAGNEELYFAAQLKHACLGLVIFFVFGWLIPIHLVNTYTYVIFAVVCLLLLVVLIMGHTAGGAQRWVILGPVRLQPSEIAKLALALTVAKFFYNNRNVVSYTLTRLWPLLLTCLMVFVLIFKQPDFGTAGTVLAIAIAQLAFVRIAIGWRTVAFIAVGCVLMSVLGWYVFLHSYQKLRILTLINPNLDPSGSGYNSLQSLVAIGSGQQFGKGFLQGTQTQLQFLPARHTDFIFSVFAEEHGFVGGLVVFLLFTFVTYLALEIAREARDAYCSLSAIGIAAMLYIAYIINIAMVLGMFPVVGMPLPFFSYGGSALISSCIAMGLLVAIERENSQKGRGSRFEIG